MDKGKPIPIIIKKKIEERPPLQVNVGQREVKRRISREENFDLNKIVEDSDSNFYITGKTTKIGLMNFLSLIEKHDLNEVEEMSREDIIISSELITKIATASVVDEDEEDMKYIDSAAIGIFVASLALSIFSLLTQIDDIRTLAWILFPVSTAILAHYLYKGYKSGELSRIIRICIKTLSKK